MNKIGTKGMNSRIGVGTWEWNNWLSNFWWRYQSVCQSGFKKDYINLMLCNNQQIS